MKTKELVCKNCGNSFRVRMTVTNRTCCDDPKCKVEWQRKTNRENARRRRNGERLEPTPCIICGNYFQPKTSRSDCCSSECGLQKIYKKRRLDYSRLEEYRESRKQLVKDYAVRNPEKVAIASAIRVRKWRATNKRKYQAQSNEKRFDGNWLKTMDRNEWMCQICGEDAQLLHHKDKDKQNNSLSNLTALCRACHMNIHRDDINCVA